MSENSIYRGFGWLPDYPDFRDYTSEYNNISQKLKLLGQKDSVKAMLKKAGVTDTKRSEVPESMDLRKWCPPVEDQLNLGSCTANAGVAMVEYFEKKAFGKHIEASRLFLYKVTRNLLKFAGDTGAYLRSTMAALTLFGTPPEEYWPYEVADFDNEPTAFCYAFAQNYQAMSYYRLDPPGTDQKDLLGKIKSNLAASLPLMFGFTVYDSIRQASDTGKIPYPADNDKVAGGHAIVAVGYDDKMKIKNINPGGKETTGALLIRNSWSEGWGEKGYGWLPYEYILSGLAEDWWSLLKNEWIDTGEFKI